jgi:uncharacterized protein
MAPKLTSEIFWFSHEGANFLYVPLRKLLLRVNRSAVEFVKALKTNRFDEDIGTAAAETLRVLQALELVDGEPDTNLVAEDYSPFEPIEVTLFLTNQCNLRCIYCYASAGDMKPETMAPFIGEAAINTIVKNASKNSIGEIQLGFHGGGEPTLEWDLLVHLTKYCKRQAEIYELSANISMATNGILSNEQVDWLVDNLNGVNLSFDGTEKFQNYQRPLIDGSGSFEVVYKTAKRMDQHNFPYGIRCTVTDENVRALEEIVRFIGREFNCSYVHLEPVFVCGRCCISSVRAPESQVFVEHFRRASNIAAKKKLKLIYSGARANVLTPRFCLAEGGCFCVTCNGDVTSCYEVTSRDDPLSKLFWIGRLNAESKEFEFKTDLIEQLRRSKSLNTMSCNDCFCKYHCAGDCLAKRLRAGQQHTSSSLGRCYINRELTKDQLLVMEKSCRVGEEVD